MERPTTQSEVARLLQHIGEEYESAQAGLVGYAITARHQMINARLEAIGRLHEELHGLVGDAAMHLIAQQLDHASEVSLQEQPAMTPDEINDIRTRRKE